MKSEKEIIDEIVSRLHAQPDRRYKEGAWENFNKKYNASGTKVQRIKYWASAAAALLVLGMGGLYVLKTDHSTTVDPAVELASDHNMDKKESGPDGQARVGDADNGTSELTYPRNSAADRHTDRIAAKGAAARIQKKNNEHLSLTVEANALTLSSLQLSPGENAMVRQHINTKGVESNAKVHVANLKDNISPLTIPNDLVLASKSVPTKAVNLREVDPLHKSNNFKLTDKFDLGLFVSPYATGDKMNVGGGMTLAYNVTKKLSIRTGASYNSYEVGMLKNPTEAASAEAIVVHNSPNTSKNAISAAAPAQSKMMLPNINAVTSVVQSVDIPLELKYNVGKSLYATAGVSYSAIIGQERNAHYIDNINAQTFTDGFPEDEKQQSNTVRAVTKTVKSAEPNVNTNGFNGFVNFSLGKKVKVNNQFGMSVEPYVKIPVGQYRRADMDYTNGGIRIMTNF